VEPVLRADKPSGSNDPQRQSASALAHAGTFVISLHKTGTSSVHAYAQRAGLRARHAPAYENGVDLEKMASLVLSDKKAVLEVLSPILENYDFHSDIPWPGLYRELASRYPDARFVYLERDPGQWLRSLIAHWSLDLMPRRLRPFEVIQYADFLPPGKRIITRDDAALLRQAFVRHRADVISAIPGHRLLLLDLQAGDAAARLSGFLDLPVTIELRHENRRWAAWVRALRNLNSRLRNWQRFGTRY
jgi:hypothetical protein